MQVINNSAVATNRTLVKALARGPIALIEADVRDRLAVAGAVVGCDYIFHQAAIRITHCAEQPRECIDVLVGGTFNVFEAAVANGVRKFVVRLVGLMSGGRVSNQ